MRLLAVALSLAAAPAAYAWDAATHYALHCQGCHLADGSETPGKVPPLAGSVAHFLRVPGGREFLVRVPGVASAPLSDADLAALLEWTLRRFDAAAIPASHAPYTAEEVARLRRDPLVDVARVRSALRAALGER
ncbi:MAG: cytochrome C [Proteobacteria bacterium]|nr:MAG: cytochrome C [Pseudomonadota bacterium]